MSTHRSRPAVRCAAVLAGVLILAGCASSPPPPYDPPPGALIAGTAQVVVNGTDLGLTDSVQCDQVGPLLMMRTGDDAAGIRVMISTADELVVEEVGLVEQGGFTGSYNKGLGGEAGGEVGGEAAVTMTDRTYDIRGSAQGFEIDNPSFRASGDFQIKIAC